MKATVTVIFHDKSSLTTVLDHGGDLHILGETLNTEFDSWGAARDFVIAKKVTAGAGSCVDLQKTAEEIERLNRKLEYGVVAQGCMLNYVYMPGHEWYVRLVYPGSKGKFMSVERALGPSDLDAC